MSNMWGIYLICILHCGLSAVKGISRGDIASLAVLREDMNHCKLDTENIYKCWIGKFMVSRDNEFYKMLTVRANPKRPIACFPSC